MKKPHRRIRVPLLSWLVLVAGLAGGSFLYINDYYHTDPSVARDLTVTADSQIVFHPETESDTGLIFYPGGKVEYTAYAPLMEKLAERGITCILVKMPANLAILGINKADGIPEQFPEIDHWYMGGHSLGGAAAAMYLASHAADYEGLVLTGAYSTVDLSDTDLSVLSLYGSADGVLNREKYDECLENLPADTTEVVLAGGCHAGFGTYGAQEGDGLPTLTSAEQQEFTADQIIEWMNTEDH